MIDPGTIKLSCSSIAQFSECSSEIYRALPPEMGERLCEIFKSYFARFGIYDTYARMNDRTVSQIFAEYQAENLKVIASGDVDGVKYHLYDSGE